MTPLRLSLFKQVCAIISACLYLFATFFTPCKNRLWKFFILLKKKKKEEKKIETTPSKLVQLTAPTRGGDGGVMWILFERMCGSDRSMVWHCSGYNIPTDIAVS